MIELLTPQEMGQADRLTIEAGIPGIELMERAGAAVASAARRMWRGGPIIVLAGPGNNGGDGFVAARLLRNAGYRVTVALFGSRQRLKGDAADAAARFDGQVVPARPESLAGAGLIIDALYGAGVRLPLPKEAIGLIEAANVSGAKLLAVDLPSGVEGATGQGTPAIQADQTITFFRRKPGHVLAPGRFLCGDLYVADIGMVAGCLTRIRPAAFLNRPELWLDAVPAPRASGHKYDRGHLLVVAGPAGFGGAARLAARGGLRAGAGLVTLASPPDALPENAARLDAVMLRACDGAAELSRILADRRKNALVLGPGLGVGGATTERVLAALRSGASVVLDADALTSFEKEPESLFRAIAGRRRPVVLTPHDGEFGRLFPAVSLAGGRLQAARNAAAIAAATIVLKGPDTVVAAPGGRAAIADNAPPDLATAGAGDVLAGMIGGLLAQRVPAFEAAAAAVYLHGEAARAFGPGLIAEDIPEALPAVLAAIRGLKNRVSV